MHRTTLRHPSRLVRYFISRPAPPLEYCTAEEAGVVLNYTCGVLDGAVSTGISELARGMRWRWLRTLGKHRHRMALAARRFDYPYCIQDYVADGSRHQQREGQSRRENMHGHAADILKSTAAGNKL
jgi:hypothetical protein